MRRLVIAAFFLAATPLFAATETYVVDKAHSSVEFRIHHLMSTVTGRFAEFSGTVNIDRAAPSNSSVEFTVQTASVNTHTADRDKHLRSSDFFDVERYPTITFKSTSIAPGKAKDTYNVTGDFTMHGVTRRVTLPVVVNGFMKDPQGHDRAGFEIATTLNRKDYGITWNKVLDPGGYLLGDDVNIDINLEAVKR